MIKIILAEDHAILRAGLQSLIERQMIVHRRCRIFDRVGRKHTLNLSRLQHHITLTQLRGGNAPNAQTRVHWLGVRRLPKESVFEKGDTHFL